MYDFGFFAQVGPYLLDSAVSLCWSHFFFRLRAHGALPNLIQSVRKIRFLASKARSQAIFWKS